jgi:signal transduction histidine kinase/CheY-like chemotaxis protein
MDKVYDKDSALAATYEDMVLGFLLTEYPLRRLPRLIAALAAAAIAFHSAPRVLLIGWAIIYVGVYVFRLLTFGWIKARSNLSVARRFRLYSLLAALDSGRTAVCLVAFPYMSQFDRAMLTVVFVAFGAGALTRIVADRRVFCSFSLPLFIPLVAAWAIFPGAESPWIGWLMAGMLALNTYYLFERSGQSDSILRESFAIRQERAELNRELQIALGTAEAASQAKTRFLASASHDLRQPIQTLSLFSAALAMRPLDERTRQIAVNINAALQDLTGELDALLDVSKLDAGIVQIQPGELRLSSMLERVHGLFSSTAQEKHLELTIACPPDAWTYTDRNHLERIVRNLVENALKYTDAGSVRIEVARDNDRYRLSVIDTGCGIPAHEQERIFEEFYQISNPERDRKRGLGLGLSIVRRLATVLNIPLALSSAPDAGTSVVLELPIAQPPTQAAPKPQFEQPIGTLHVLAVDDEESVRLGMKALLEELGCTVSLSASTHEALAEAKLKAPDILVTDLRLRGSDNGIETIRTVRKLIPNLPSLIITGDSVPERMLEAEAIGITVIQKPVSSARLLAEIGKLTTANDA